MKTYLIVGGVAGGATAAARLRRLDEQAEIVLVERGDHVSFANCGLPYYVGDVIPAQEDLLVQTPAQLKGMFRMDVRVRSTVTAVDAAAHTVTICPAEGAPYTQRYDKLLLAPGAAPLTPPIPGLRDAAEYVYTLRSVADAERIKRAAKVLLERGKGRAVVVGGGFIGIEMAENLRRRGLSVSLAEAAPQILLPFDADMARLLENEMRAQGVALYLGNGVKEFVRRADGIDVLLSDGTKLPADMVILSIGVRPDTDFLRGSGIALGERGHILINEYLETSAPDVYAVGDAVLTHDYRTGERRGLALAGPANRQGRLAADNMAGRPHVYRGVQGTSILKLFDLQAGVTGDNERMLRQRGEEYRTVIVHPRDHVAYYPGSSIITLKLIFSPEGRVLGAQAVGENGVDKRIDTIAALMRFGGTAEELSELELAYAPPFSGAKDPVNIAGYAAQNILDGIADPLPLGALDAALAAGAQLIDVRFAELYAAGHLRGAKNIPLGKLRERIGELDKNAEYLLYCMIGQKSYYAERILKQHGFRVRTLACGYHMLKELFPERITAE